MHSASPLPRHHLVLAAATVLLVAMGLGACSKDGGDAPDGSSISGLLGAVPNTEDNRGYVVVNRYDAAAAGAKIDPKGEDETDEELDRMLQLSQEAGIAGTGVMDMTRGVDQIGALGFTPSDVIASVQAGNPPNAIDLAVIDVDEGDVLDAAAKVDGAERTEVDDVDVVRWLDDNEIEMDLDTPIGRVPGQAGRVAFVDGLLATASNDTVMEDAIATAEGDGESLMDVEGIAAVAEALDDEDAFTAFIAGRNLGPGERATPSQREETPSLRSYEAIALGNAWSDDGLELVIAVAHEDEAAAKANEQALEDVVAEGTSATTATRLSELLQDPEVERDGTTVVATFSVEQPALWYQFVLRFEPFLFGG